MKRLLSAAIVGMAARGPAWAQSPAATGVGVATGGCADHEEHHMNRKRRADFGEELAKLDEADKDERERRKTKEENEFAAIQCLWAPPLLLE